MRQLTCAAIAFQSPHEDSFFSDTDLIVEAHEKAEKFQSPHEDSFFSDEPETFDHEGDQIVSIPSRGFVLL